MKKGLLMITIMLLGISILGCQGDPYDRVEDARNLTDAEYTVLNLSATDALGRFTRTGDQENDKFVGMFYHVWHGAHTTGIYNITELLQFEPEALYDIDGTPSSPLEKFHYWGEPLYGYYASSDPWVITRHIELLTMAGVDYLVYDLTNSVIYIEAINALFAELQKYHDQGFDVPKVAFYTNSGSRVTINRCYDLWYKDGLYSDLWFRFEDKPLIIGIGSELTESERALYFDFFDFRESQWPYGYNQDLENGFPWMDWDYPQTNYSGTLSVSLAQHPGARMSEQERSNNGRGFDYSLFQNKSANLDLGTNYQGQWQTVFNNPEAVDNVFITGFNEWIAIKYSDGQNVFFVDTFNEEYSRDIEMMKNGYGDNYYLQTIMNIRDFKTQESNHYLYPELSMDILNINDPNWELSVATYRDFSGDAMAREYRNASGSRTLTDQSNRNDITQVQVAHDKQNLYLRIETKDAITAYNGTDLNWMNIFLGTEESDQHFGGFEYVVNRHPGTETTSIERSTGGYQFSETGDAHIHVEGNIMQVAIPLKTIGLSRTHFNVQIKVTDNITHPDDIMDYYVSGDSAPIGRLGYDYGH